LRSSCFLAMTHYQPGANDRRNLAASVFTCLRVHNGEGVLNIGEGIPAKWQSKARKISILKRIKKP
jgi:hypothetical protein